VRAQRHQVLDLVAPSWREHCHISEQLASCLTECYLGSRHLFAG
jgi:hypothetical protein